MNYETENIIPGPMSATPAETASAFEEEYNHVRSRENRVYRDEEVMQLPIVSPGHTYAREWKHREFSCTKLITYLQNKHRPLQILEIGCGNGWLSNRLSSIPNTRTTGSDINASELEQADRVFAGKPGLSFIHGDILNDKGHHQNYDIIVFAASIQYFPSFHQTINRALEKLSEEGEIHILDSHFYTKEEIALARQRTMNYYTELGTPGMADHYYHRCLDELTTYNYQFLHKPEKSFLFRRRSHPFHWVCIKNKAVK
jgi:ubiquinone/menaquinone biosynthesis C-methylase UbiE